MTPSNFSRLFLVSIILVFANHPAYMVTSSSELLPTDLVSRAKDTEGGSAFTAKSKNRFTLASKDASDDKTQLSNSDPMGHNLGSGTRPEAGETSESGGRKTPEGDTPDVKYGIDCLKQDFTPRSESAAGKSKISHTKDTSSSSPASSEVRKHTPSQDQFGGLASGLFPLGYDYRAHFQPSSLSGEPMYGAPSGLAAPVLPSIPAGHGPTYIAPSALKVVQTAQPVQYAVLRSFWRPALVEEWGYEIQEGMLVTPQLVPTEGVFFPPPNEVPIPNGSPQWHAPTMPNTSPMWHAPPSANVPPPLHPSQRGNIAQARTSPQTRVIQKESPTDWKKTVKNTESRCSPSAKRNSPGPFHKKATERSSGRFWRPPVSHPVPVPPSHDRVPPLGLGSSNENFRRPSSPGYIGAAPPTVEKYKREGKNDAKTDSSGGPTIHEVDQKPVLREAQAVAIPHNGTPNQEMSDGGEHPSPTDNNSRSLALTRVIKQTLEIPGEPALLDVRPEARIPTEVAAVKEGNLAIEVPHSPHEIDKGTGALKSEITLSRTGQKEKQSKPNLGFQADHEVHMKDAESFFSNPISISSNDHTHQPSNDKTTQTVLGPVPKRKELMELQKDGFKDKRENSQTLETYKEATVSRQIVSLRARRRKNAKAVFPSGTQTVAQSLYDPERVETTGKDDTSPIELEASEERRESKRANGLESETIEKARPAAPFEPETLSGGTVVQVPKSIQLNGKSEAFAGDIRPPNQHHTSENGANKDFEQTKHPMAYKLVDELKNQSDDRGKPFGKGESGSKSPIMVDLEDNSQGDKRMTQGKENTVYLVGDGEQSAEKINQVWNGSRNAIKTVKKNHGKASKHRKKGLRPDIHKHVHFHAPDQKLNEVNSQGVSVEAKGGSQLTTERPNAPLVGNSVETQPLTQSTAKKYQNSPVSSKTQAQEKLSPLVFEPSLSSALEGLLKFPGINLFNPQSGMSKDPHRVTNSHAKIADWIEGDRTEKLKQIPDEDIIKNNLAKFTEVSSNPKELFFISQFQNAFQPWNDGHHEGQLFTEILKNSYMSSESKFNMHEDSIDTTSLSQRWGEAVINKWRANSLDLDMMNTLASHLKFCNHDDHLPLEFMEIQVYEKLKYYWKINPKKFLSAQWWFRKYIGRFEGDRRVLTLSKQILQHTLSLNWTLIKENLISTKKLSESDAANIEQIFHLSQKVHSPEKQLCNTKTLELLSVEFGKTGETVICMLSRVMGLQEANLRFKYLNIINLDLFQRTQ